ncbi:hypothetical protein BANRA_05432 [Klebsiella pneumoniae]|nr:hypothetical protein BANRA_05432 [Klebsiella pneumoniae]
MEKIILINNCSEAHVLFTKMVSYSDLPELKHSLKRPLKKFFKSLRLLISLSDINLAECEVSTGPNHHSYLI